MLIDCACLGAFNEVVEFALGDVLLLVVSHWTAFLLVAVKSDPVPLAYIYY
jgi:hypothetical protein